MSTKKELRANIGNFHDCGKYGIIQSGGREAAAGKERAHMKGATTIQERLWDLRKEKGLNLEELAQLTKISKSALASYESKDNKEINHGNLITLADFYGVSIDYLLCRTESVIVHDIRAAHKSDSESAPPTTIAEELKQDLEDVANFKGSPLEKQAALYCKRLGINYNKLSDVEFRQLVHILEKSKFFKSYVGQRKKRK